MKEHLTETSYAYVVLYSTMLYRNWERNIKTNPKAAHEYAVGLDKFLDQIEAIIAPSLERAGYVPA